MTTLTRNLVNELPTAPEPARREVLEFLAVLKTRDLAEGERNELAVERADWLRLSARSLARAFGPDEPDDPDSCPKERNPLYEGR